MSAVARLMFFACVAVILAGCVATVVGQRRLAGLRHGPGRAGCMAGEIRRGAPQCRAGRGSIRYIAVCLLSGYVWLAGRRAWRACRRIRVGPCLARRRHSRTGTGLRVRHGVRPRANHPPAVAGVKVGFHPVFYIPLALLHLTLAWRVAGAVLPTRGASVAPWPTRSRCCCFRRRDGVRRGAGGCVSLPPT